MIKTLIFYFISISFKAININLQNLCTLLFVQKSTTEREEEEETQQQKKS